MMGRQRVEEILFRSAADEAMMDAQQNLGEPNLDADLTSEVVVRRYQRGVAAGVVFQKVHFQNERQVALVQAGVVFQKDYFQDAELQDAE